MTEKELRRLSRADLLEMLIDQNVELNRLKARLAEAEEELRSRSIAIDEAGSIAEAALEINGVFEAAQAACEQYVENIRSLSGRQEEVCRRREEESARKAQALLDEAQRRCETLERETREDCERMVEEAREASEAYWDDVAHKLEAFCANHAEVLEIFGAIRMNDKE